MKAVGYIHIHSTYSHDGSLLLDNLKNIFTDKGCSFIFVTEHTENLSTDVAYNFIDHCNLISSKSFLVIPGFELPDKYGNHILILGVKRYYQSDNTLSVLERYIKDGSLIILAHPYSKGKPYIDNDILMLLNGCEVWNSAHDGNHCPRFSSLLLSKKLRRINHNIYLFAGLDMHKDYQIKGPCLMLDINKLDTAEILHCLRNGKFIVSNKRLEIYTDGKLAHLVILKIFFVSFISISVLKVLRIMGSLLRRIGIKDTRKLKCIMRKFI